MSTSLGVNAAGPNCYVVLRDGCLYVYQNERSSTPDIACSLYGYLQYVQIQALKLQQSESTQLLCDVNVNVNRKMFNVAKIA